MQRRIGAHWFIETLRFALLIEETVLVALSNKEIKLEVAPRELHTASNRCPLAEGDRLAFGGAIGQCIAADDILFQYVSEREEVWLLSHLSEMLTECVRLFHHTTPIGLYGVDCTVCV